MLSVASIEPTLENDDVLIDGDVAQYKVSVTLQYLKHNVIEIHFYQNTA